MRTMFFSLLASVAFPFLASSAHAGETGGQEHPSLVIALADDTPAGSQSIAVPGPISSSEWTLDTSITWKSGRPFEDQGYTLTHDPVIETEATACRRNLCFDIWRADTGHTATHETDFQVWKSFAVGTDTTVQVKAAYYELDGPDVSEVKLSISHPLSDSCTATGSYEHMWQSFKENVWRVESVCTVKMSDKVTIDLTPRIAHSENFNQWVPAVDVGVSFPLNDAVDTRLFAIAFGGREPDFFVGVQVSRMLGK